ncbi:MAG: hypothetical protein ACRBN8_18055 [Nannocystales bacterium]
MDPTDFTLLLATLRVTCAALTAAAVISCGAGLFYTASGRSGWARALGHPLVALVTAAAVVALAAVGQWGVTHTVLGAAFAPTEDGWRRVSLVGFDPSAAMDATASLQRWASLCVATLVPVSWIAAWRFDPSRETTAVVASVVGTVALSLPVLAACGGILWMADTMIGHDPSEAMWEAWHILEASKWAVAGVAAVGLMAATPVVMHAASKGNVVSSRTHQLSQALLLVGLAAWSTSRFASEDLARGPMASLERGESAWRRPTPERALPAVRDLSLQLPIASHCSEVPFNPSRQRVLPLELGPTQSAAAPVSTWEAHSEDDRTPVLVAAVDRRAPPHVYQPALVKAQALGVEQVAIVTLREDEQQSLTLGTLHAQSPCVLGWLPIGHALRLSSEGSQWTTLAYAASHPH